MERETFSDGLTDTSSNEFKNLEARVLNTCSAIYKKEFGKKFQHCKVKKFSALPSTRATGTEATIEVVFNRSTPIADLPQNNVVAEILKKAVTNTNNTFNVSINPDSVKVLEGPVPGTTTGPTTAAPTTATSTTAVPTTATTTTAVPTTAASTTSAPTTAAPITLTPEPVYILSVDLERETFSDALTDTSSNEFKNLEARVLNTCSAIYKKEFGKKFQHCKVKKFRALPSTRAAGTEATIEVVFNRSTPIADLPQNNVVAEILKKAVTNTNSTFNVSINPDSVKVLEGPVPGTTTGPTTAAPMTATTTTSAPTTATTTTVAPTTATATTALLTTGISTAAATAIALPMTVSPTTAASTIARVSFRSVYSTFTNELLNPSSTAFKNRAAMIKGQLELVFYRAFPSSFKSLEVVSFSRGSVINTMDLSFESPFPPSNTQIKSVLINAASRVSGFDIEGSSIIVNGISSSGVSQKMSLITASCFVLLSWLLSSQQ
ncbi:cell wall protein DAN4 [Etheostoma spectabile]|uniref:cell wall protein DAN4 n=1 Tax=Etheostoma spectabile TaxID=54343 RepID=UPI0013AF8024|nr:cell wall protein DAN4-like [Etheostoma spectabile]